MSHVIALYHLVFATKNRRNTIPLENRPHLYKYIWHLLQERKCVLRRINGIQNHVHILVEIHQDVALSSLVKDLKSMSSSFLRNHQGFPSFEGWGEGYYAATVSYGHMAQMTEYIKRQEEHHLRQPFDDELTEMLQRYGFALHPRDYK